MRGDVMPPSPKSSAESSTVVTTTLRKHRQNTHTATMHSPPSPSPASTIFPANQIQNQNPSPPPPGTKPCTLCHHPRNVLVRCQIDASHTWHFLCPGTCWKRASGGVIDGDGGDGHEWYRYGGMWKNRVEMSSAKRKKGAKNEREKGEREGEKIEGEEVGERKWSPKDESFAKDERVLWKRRMYVCRKGHASCERRAPDVAPSLWKGV